MCTAEWTLDNGRTSRLSAQEQPVGIGFMLPQRAVSLTLPSKHVCERREVGERLGQGGRAQGGRRGEVKVGISIHSSEVSFPLLTFDASLLRAVVPCSQCLQPS